MSCRNAKPGDIVAEPALRELYRSGLFTVQPSCGDGDVIEYLCIDCGLRFEQTKPSELAVRTKERELTVADHAFDVPRHRVVARCSCGSLEAR